MKHIVLSLTWCALLILPGILKAQYAIPNGSFENWTGTNQPAGWTVVQGKPVQQHMYSYQLIDSFGDTTHLQREAYDGGSFINMPMVDTSTPCIIRQKFAMTARPRYFSMNYAYFPETQQNQFQVNFIFTKWDTVTGKEDTILSGTYNSYPGAIDPPWTTLLNADLTTLYDSSLTLSPDSAVVTITSSLQTSPNAGTVLLIDEIYFTDTIVSAGVKIPENEPLSSSSPSVFPNPFSEKTVIRYCSGTGGQVLLSVYDINGKKVADLVNGSPGPGIHEVVFNASGLKDGVYYYLLQTGEDIQSGKLILAR